MRPNPSRRPPAVTITTEYDHDVDAAAEVLVALLRLPTTPAKPETRKTRRGPNSPGNPETAD